MKCDFDKLWLYLNNKLGTDAQAEVLEHLSKCDICCQAICQVARDHETDLFIHERQKMGPGGKWDKGRNEGPEAPRHSDIH